MKNLKALYEAAYKISEDRKLGSVATCGGVGAALLAENGKMYTGIFLDVACGIGFCAEHSAIAEMIKNGESNVKEIIAVTDDKKYCHPAADVEN